MNVPIESSVVTPSTSSKAQVRPLLGPLGPAVYVRCGMVSRRRPDYSLLGPQIASGYHPDQKSLRHPKQSGIHQSRHASYLKEEQRL